MKILGNIIWIIFGGWLTALVWIFAGLVQCITIIGIPTGIQAFKLARLSFLPFGKEIEYGAGAGSFILNILWLVLGGIWLAVAHAFLGLIYFITIIGIPFGKQYFKLAGLSLRPFGATIKNV